MTQKIRTPATRRGASAAVIAATAAVSCVLTGCLMLTWGAGQLREGGSHG